MNDLTFRRGPGEEKMAPSAPQDAIRQDAGPAGPAPFLLQALRIARRRKWLLLGAVAIALILGIVITMLMTPQYTASATLEIQRENNNVVGVRGLEPETTAIDLEFYQTQYGLLRARSLAERVATDLRLNENPAFFDMFGPKRIADAIREGGRAVTRAQRDERIAAAADVLLGRIGISPARSSRLVDVSFASPNAELSARIVNAWTQNFVELTLSRRFDATAHARRFLEDRLEQLRQRLEESERNLVNYASQQRIINIPSTSTTSTTPGGGMSTTERPLVAEDLATMNQELNAAIAERTTAESRLHAAGGSTTEALQNQAISTLRARRAELAAENARLLTQFEPQYPPVQALQNQIRQLDLAIGREEGRIHSTLQATYQAAAAREAALRARVEGLQSSMLDLRRRTIQYTIFQREVDTNRQLYDALLQRYREIGVAGGVGVNNISVVDPAEVPDHPSSPKLLLNMLLALVVGCVAGGGIALALEQIDDAISDPSVVEPLIGLPLLGAIPKSDGKPESELDDRKSSLVEAYLSTQTRLAFTTDHGLPRTITVTSTRPGEGKTTTSYALARSLARTGRKVLLVDGDMRSPSLHHFYELKNDRGFSNFLAGANDVQSLIHQDVAERISLMTAGPPPPNAAELLMGDRIRKLMEECLETFDHVIIDMPPVMGLADTPIMASQVEGVVFVIESHATRATAARVAVGRLQDAHAHVLGVLLTKFEARRAHYGYGYDYGYGYGENANRTES